MSDVAYVRRLQRHLGDYRARVLGVEPGQWGNPARTYRHILPPASAHLNIVEPLRQQFQTAQATKRWKLHRYFHHLSSSQALAFNAFLPIYPEVPEAFVATRCAIGLLDGKADVDFEVELAGGDGTNIDVLVTEHPERRTVIEAKLTEASFGRATHDERHLVKLRTIYEPLLRGRLADDLLRPEVFFRDYQLFRQLAQLRPTSEDRVVLLLPRGRRRLWDHASLWCTQSRLGDLSARISIVALEDLLAALHVDTHAAGAGVQAVLDTTAKYLPSG